MMITTILLHGEILVTKHEVVEIGMNSDDDSMAVVAMMGIVVTTTAGMTDTSATTIDTMIDDIDPIVRVTSMMIGTIIIIAVGIATKMIDVTPDAVGVLADDMVGIVVLHLPVVAAVVVAVGLRLGGKYAKIYKWQQIILTKT